MWAGSLVLRIGYDRDLLVRVQFDTDTTGVRLRALFESWLELTPPDDLDSQPVSFSVRLESAGGDTPRRDTHLRAVPQLRHGSKVIARSRHADDILRAFALVIGGVHAGVDDKESLWIGLRPFAKDGSVVLVGVDTPALVNDRLLGLAGVNEIAAWDCIIDASGMVLVPPVLPNLSWSGVGLEAPDEGWQRLNLAGIVMLEDQAQTVAERVSYLATQSTDSRWFRLIADLAERATLRGVPDRTAVRDAIRELLGA